MQNLIIYSKENIRNNFSQKVHNSDKKVLKKIIQRIFQAPEKFSLFLLIFAYIFSIENSSLLNICFLLNMY
jgi:hypothetical protein